MGLRFEDNKSFGEGSEDIRQFLIYLARNHGGAITHFADAVCACGARDFGITVDESRSCLTLDCEECRRVLYLGATPITIEDKGAEVCNCDCYGDCFEVCAGMAQWPGKTPRRLFLAARCSLCGLVASYADQVMAQGTRKPAWHIER